MWWGQICSMGFLSANTTIWRTFPPSFQCDTRLLLQQWIVKKLRNRRKFLLLVVKPPSQSKFRLGTRKNFEKFWKILRIFYGPLQLIHMVSHFHPYPGRISHSNLGALYLSFKSCFQNHMGFSSQPISPELQSPD